MYFKILSCRDSKEKKIQVSYNSDMTSKDAFLKYKAKISQYSKAQFREETMDLSYKVEDTEGSILSP